MRKPGSLVLLLAVALLSANANPEPDQFTALVVSPLADSGILPFQGTDGRIHIVYELVLTNTNPTPATPRKIEVVDGAHPSRVFAAYAGAELLQRLRTSGSAAVENPAIEFNGTRLFLVDLTFDSAAAPPARLMHRIEALVAPSPDRRPTTPVALTYTVAPLTVSRNLMTIGPPLAGKHWVTVNGCCGPTAIHRASGLTVNGKIYFAQRFAVDWMLLDAAGRFVHGDAADVHNYSSYGAGVLSVADGTVVGLLDELKDQKPGSLPDPKTITLKNVDGNHIVLDLGHGVFAFYAHLQKGSIRVAVGDHVKRGQVLAKLGNTGNTSAPHLHFHLMDSPSVLGSSGIPYAMDSLGVAGQVSLAKFTAAPGVEGKWGEGLLSTPSYRHGQFPLDLNIVDFPPQK